MVRSLFARRSEVVGAARLGRNVKARPRRLQPSVDGLEGRALLTGGSVTLSSGVVSVVPDSTISQNTAIVSYGTGSHAGQLDVNLNGSDHYYASGSVVEVFFNGYHMNTNVTFQNKTSVTSIAYGGSGTNVFDGGSGVDEFIGGSGSNTFNAGTGFDIMEGGSGSNIFNESATGSGEIFKDASSDTINVSAGETGHYYVY